MKYKTFSTKGLKKHEVDLLAEAEKDWFKGIDISRAWMIQRVINAPIELREGLLEAFNYWEWMPKPLMRATAKKPILLSKLLIRSKHGSSVSDSKTYERWTVTESALLKELEIGMLEGLSTYYEIINNCLYIKYNQIIGSRFIAEIKNDFK